MCRTNELHLHVPIQYRRDGVYNKGRHIQHFNSEEEFVSLLTVLDTASPRIVTDVKDSNTAYII
jgi:hypothetical protein